MQKYTDITEDKTLRESRQLLLDNDMTALTNQAGESAPTGLQAGMTWYDSTNKVLKIYNGSSWDTFSFNSHTHSYVPTTRKVNNKALSADISLTASDVGAVPTTRKVNNKALSADVSLTASDVGAAASSHSHNYAGSSSAGGAATSANKLNTNAGNASTPVYFSNGVPVACTGGGSVGAYISESKYNSDGSWYRKWSDGWIEQGGKITTYHEYGHTYNFLIPYVSGVPYYCVAHYMGTQSPDNYTGDSEVMTYREIYPQKLTKTGFNLYGNHTKDGFPYKAYYYSFGK